MKKEDFWLIVCIAATVIFIGLLGGGVFG